MHLGKNKLHVHLIGDEAKKKLNIESNVRRNEVLILKHRKHSRSENIIGPHKRDCIPKIKYQSERLLLLSFPEDWKRVVHNSEPCQIYFFRKIQWPEEGIEEEEEEAGKG